MVMKDCLEKNVQKKVLIEKHREYFPIWCSMKKLERYF